ncbi:hypothetical protein MTR67_003048 [Solanum verrucosum]|uniref:Uncharacterized protein n=1 Tax=Solanum verrucosum TaxID=315347 RepID=A0AAF0PRP5_SOLVR|nr:hypothetical protein MTR67_003048 [Solanum verrucosum]
MENQWITKEVRSPYGCGVWITLGNQWRVFWDKVEITVGNESKTEFREDQWIGGPTAVSQVTIARVYNWDVHQRKFRQAASPKESL